MTDLIEVKEALREREERLRAIFEAAENVSLIMTDLAGEEAHILEFSPGAERIFGYPREEVIGKSVAILHLPEDVSKFPEVIESMRQRKAGFTGESTLVRKSGEKFPALFTTYPIFHAEGNMTATLGVSIDITERKHAEEELRTYQVQLRSLVSELLFTEERERRRLATDLHDSIGQILAISKIKLDALRSAAPLAPVTGDLDEVRELTGEAIQQTRSLTYDLSPPALYQLGLEAALESLVERMEELHGIRVDLTDDKQPKPLSEDLAVLLFRSVQELLLNILKHAQTRDARVSIGRDGDEVRITVADDGIGFDISEIDSHVDREKKFGLFSISERLDHLGGHFEIASKPGQGTQVILLAPLQSDR